LSPSVLSSPSKFIHAFQPSTVPGNTAGYNFPKVLSVMSLYCSECLQVFQTGSYTRLVVAQSGEYSVATLVFISWPEIGFPECSKGRNIVTILNPLVQPNIILY